MKKYTKTLLAIATLALMGASVASADNRSRSLENDDRARTGDGDTTRSAPLWRSGEPLDLETERAERLLRHEWLVRERTDEGLATPLRVAVDDADRAAVAERVFGRAPRIGVVKPVDVTVDFAGALTSRSLAPGAVQSMPHGALATTIDGGFVYTWSFEAMGAAGMRVHFEDFALPGNAELHLYTEDGQVFGPYTGSGPHGDGDFWSHSLVGSRVVLQLRQHGMSSIKADVPSLRITGIAAILAPDLARTDQAESEAPGEDTFCSYNADCIEPGGTPSNGCGANGAVDDARYAVAHMQWVSGPFVNFCSGGLLNDSGSTGTPYFLTANHCISRGKDAKNLENFFQHWLADCSAPFSCPSWSETRSGHDPALRTLGATILSTSSAQDYTLMELSEPAPAGSVFLGWTSAEVANSNDTPLYRLSHPSAAPQAYSAQKVDTSKGTCTGYPRGDFIYSTDTFGATEGGSSGSPVVNADGEVVGQLFGACGPNPSDSCDGRNATMDGAFAAYYSDVEQWLGPESCASTETCDNGSDDDCDGYVDCADSDCSGDPACTCTPSTEICDDGQDNDCDGATDCDDSDCSGDPACDTGSCGGHNDPCDSNADCCSNNCKRGSCKGN